MAILEMMKGRLEEMMEKLDIDVQGKVCTNTILVYCSAAG